jgi:hypothetical protein
MFRFTLREIFLLTVVVAMGTVLAVEHWPAPDGKRLTKTEVEVYSAALRFAIAREGANGLIFVSIAGNDPPKKLAGTVLLPAPQADVFAVKDHSRDDPTPNERVRHKKTGEAGSIVTATIVGWLAGDRVKVKVSSYTAGLWAGGDTIILIRKEGQWVVESIDENESWVS